MQSIEVSGKSVAEAKKNAAAKLGVDEDQMTVTVLEETKGLFGKSNVRIRAEVSASAPTSAVVEAPTVETVEEPKAAEEAKPEKPKRAPRAKAAPKAEAAPVEAPVEAAAEEFTDDTSAQGPSATEQDLEQLTDLVRDLLSAGDLEVNATGAGINGRYVNIELDGRDVAHLVGKHGEVLNALQYLVNIIAGRRFNNGIRATLDGNNYRRRREDALYQLATRVADEVKNRGEEAVLDALPAFERRIIHKSLSEYKGVQTYSEGEEPNRRVVIAPAD